MRLLAQDDDGLYYSIWLDEAITKRARFTESRRKNRSNPNKKDLMCDTHETHMRNICDSYVEHMENENVNANENANANENKDTNETETTNAAPSCLPDKPAEPTCPYEEILSLYNGICIHLPQAMRLNDTRKRLIRARWRENPSIEAFALQFHRANDSAFLTGDNDRAWRASLDWILSPTNWTKIQENQYEKVLKKEIIHDRARDIEDLFGN